MLFNSIEFLYFLPIVLLCYWILKGRTTLQNTFILVASYFFYGWWNWKLLPLIIFTSFCSWFCSLRIGQTTIKNKKKIYVGINVIVNLLILFYFKYSNFFITSFVDAFTMMGKSINVQTLNIILPVGISFYTFQALSYSIDVYKEKIQPTSNIIIFFAYVSFFPQLVAGPIERATNLLPQFSHNRKIDADTFLNGLRQMLWGFFKKMVIADTLAGPVNEAFANYPIYPASTLILAAFLFSFQIYCDFSGYSDIAIGTSRLFGFNLMRNFNYPYFSRDIAEFWRRWHISLTTWFRDYVYIPLGGSRVPKHLIIRNTFIIYLLSGLWHGPNWTFVFWGGINALLFIPLILTGKNRKHLGIIAENRHLPSLKEWYEMIRTFLLASLCWIFFRAETIADAFHYCQNIVSSSLLSIPRFRGLTNVDALFGMAFIALMLILEWINRNKTYGIEFDSRKHPICNYCLCTLIFILIYCFGVDNSSFIYFQF